MSRVSRNPVQRVSAVALVLGLILLFVTWSSTGAKAAGDNTDEITGVGATGSSVTTNWADGLLGSDNKTIVSPRSQGDMDPAFYNGTFDQFKNIQVTVSQTEDIGHQAVAVNWTGAPTTPSNRGSDFFQIMQCYGDSNAGPDPEDCEYGSLGLLAGTGLNSGIASRAGFRCRRPPELAVTRSKSARHICPQTQRLAMPTTCRSFRLVAAPRCSTRTPRGIWSTTSTDSVATRCSRQ